MCVCTCTSIVCVCYSVLVYNTHVLSPRSHQPMHTRSCPPTKPDILSSPSPPLTSLRPIKCPRVSKGTPPHNVLVHLHNIRRAISYHHHLHTITSLPSPPYHHLHTITSLPPPPYHHLNTFTSIPPPYHLISIPSQYHLSTISIPPHYHACHLKYMYQLYIPLPHTV